MTRIRLGVVVTHPIQYHAPLYRLLADSYVVDLEVWFLSDHGVRAAYDPGFGRMVEFDVPLLDGYSHRFLRGYPARSEGAPGAQVHPEVVGLVGSADVVLVHGYAYPSAWLTFATCRSRRIPYLLRGESRPESDTSTPRWRSRARRLAVEPLVRSAVACLAIGQRNRAFYESCGAAPEDIFDAPYSVDNERFRRSAEAGRSTREAMLIGIGADPSRPVALFASKLLPSKAPQDFIAAATTTSTPCTAIVIGDGPLRPEVEAAAKRAPNLFWLGFVNQAEIGHWYGIADAFVLPSHREPWGLAVNEAMAAGAVPIVSDSVGAQVDLVDSTTGRVFPTGDAGRLRAALDELLVDAALRGRLREAGSRRVDGFSLAATALGIEAGAVHAMAKRS